MKSNWKLNVTCIFWEKLATFGSFGNLQQCVGSLWRLVVFMPIHGGFFNFWEFRQLLAADGSLLRFMAQLLRFEVPAMQWKSGGLTKQRLEGLAQLLRPGANSESLWQLFSSLWQLMAIYSKCFQLQRGFGVFWQNMAVQCDLWLFIAQLYRLGEPILNGNWEG